MGTIRTVRVARMSAWR
ncbi:hypothetical protein NP493_649g00001 [Ridgeia piscesae]|uniref:Uncharacterized protein n=1 Tax=Ridgeia piscesae TaxID=27915 RepID=A0AAD9NNL0_RIDPI|nr:hypothetical protein NP493_649g00001 [Ridgeia piscesae]